MFRAEGLRASGLQGLGVRVYRAWAYVARFTVQDFGVDFCSLFWFRGGGDLMLVVGRGAACRRHARAIWVYV